MLAIGLHAFVHLDRELARGREHERLHLRALQIDRLEDRVDLKLVGVLLFGGNAGVIGAAADQ